MEGGKSFDPLADTVVLERDNPRNTKKVEPWKPGKIVWDDGKPMQIVATINCREFMEKLFRKTE